MLRRFLGIAALVAGLALPAAASAATAVVTNDLNLRGGPGTQYQRITTIPNGAAVEVLNCDPYNWCNVVWNGISGYVAGTYLAYVQDGYQAPPTAVYPPYSGPYYGGYWGPYYGYPYWGDGYRNRDYDRRPNNRPQGRPKPQPQPPIANPRPPAAKPSTPRPPAAQLQPPRPPVAAQQRPPSVPQGNPNRRPPLDPYMPCPALSSCSGGTR